MKHSILITTAAMALTLSACGSPEVATPDVSSSEAASLATKVETAGSATGSTAAANHLPSDYIDLSHWNITVPLDQNADGKVDVVKIKDIQTFSHPDFFYANKDCLLYTSPSPRDRG